MSRGASIPQAPDAVERCGASRPDSNVGGRHAKCVVNSCGEQAQWDAFDENSNGVRSVSLDAGRERALRDLSEVTWFGHCSMLP